MHRVPTGGPRSPLPVPGATSPLLPKLPRSVSRLAGSWTALASTPVRVYLNTLFLTLDTETRMLWVKATNERAQANSEKIALPGTSFQRACCWKERSIPHLLTTSLVHSALQKMTWLKGEDQRRQRSDTEGHTPLEPAPRGTSRSSKPELLGAAGSRIRGGRGQHAGSHAGWGGRPRQGGAMVGWALVEEPRVRKEKQENLNVSY